MGDNGHSDLSAELGKWLAEAFAENGIDIADIDPNTLTVTELPDGSFQFDYELIDGPRAP